MLYSANLPQEAATLPCTYLSSIYALYEEAGVRKGQVGLLD